jgi:hypothetical protein
MLSETDKEINATIRIFNDQNHSHQAQNYNLMWIIFVLIPHLMPNLVN